MAKNNCVSSNKPKDVLKPKCGLCGSRKKKLTKTECCDNWICDDEHTYQLFSYARNSCYRNHRRYTLCATHKTEGHKGRWQDCKKCKNAFDIPNYNYFGTNEYNFEILKNIEEYTISCVKCGFTTDSMEHFAYQTSKGYYCGKEECQDAALQR